MLGISGAIPTLVFVDPVKDVVISKDGRSKLFEDPKGLEFPWPTKVKNIADGIMSIGRNSIPVVIAFCEEADESEQTNIKDALDKANQKCLDEATENGRALDEGDFDFMIATKIDNDANLLRRIMYLPVLSSTEQVGRRLEQTSCKLVLLDEQHGEYYESGVGDSSIAALENLMAGFLDGSLPPKNTRQE